jgi:ribosome modulation factor
MNAKSSFEETVKTYENMLSQRAFQEGYAAYMAGVERTAIPARLNVFSGNWVEGWLAASEDAATQPGAPKSIDDQAHAGFRIPMVRNAALVHSTERLN